jgi:type IV secretion system protein VirB10
MAWMLMTTFVGTQAWATTMAAARQAEMAQTASPQTTELPQTPAAPSAAAGTIDVPVGTKVPLNLVNPIMSLSTTPGATVRAVVAFPVTVGNQVAIPAGTFVEGQLISARAAGTKPKKGTSGPALQIHFTKLVYANGYTVPLDAQKTEARVSDGAASDAEVASAGDAPQMPVARSEHGPDGGAAFLEGQFGTPFPPQQLPTQPSRPGPNPVAITLGAVGGFVLLTLGAVLLARHGAKPVDETLYDAGWQFSMALTSPLKLDKTQVMDAARMAPAS